jgi:glycosyltransferase involved in cell wall biosynthesis
MLCLYMRHPDDEGFAALEERARRWRATLLPIDDWGPLDAGLPGRVRAACARHRPAIWHAHDYKSNLLGLAARRSHPMRLVTTVHCWTVRGSLRSELYYALDRLLLRHYDQVICVSEDLRRRSLDAGVAPDRCWHVPNAIDTEEYRRSRPSDAAKRALGVAPGRRVIGAVGRLSREKAFDALIASTGRLVADALDVELWIAGEGPERPRLEEAVARLGLRERVRLLGHRADLEPLYEAMDLFVLSSTHEGLPNALLEAMAFSVPAVATRVAGVPGLIRDGENGLLVEPGSVEALTAAMRTLLDDADLRGRLALSGRRTIEETYSFSRRMADIKTIYDRTLGVEAR